MERINENECDFRFGDWGAKYIHRGPHMEWGILLFKPNQALGAHYHTKTQEVFYFIEGTPKIIVDDKEYRVRIGEAFKIYEGEVHNIINDTDSVTKIIFIKAPYNPDDKVDCLI